MIRLFLKGFPRELSVELMKEYKRQVYEFEFLWERHADRYEWVRDKEAICLIIALSVFYNKIVAPMTSAGNFYDFISKKNVSAVKIGSYTIGEENANEFMKIGNAFNEMLLNFKLSEYVLCYDNIERLLYNLKISLETNYEAEF